MSEKNLKHIVLGVTGSIAAYKAPDLARSLKKKNYRVTCVMTKRAQEFITPLTLATVSDEKVWTAMFDAQAQERIGHISLSQEADMVLLAPATANVIGKIANGIADDLLTATVMATQAPVCIAPAMNERMWNNRFVQKNCQTLKDAGMVFIGPAQGSLACGDSGDGRLVDVEEIVKAVEKILG